MTEHGDERRIGRLPLDRLRCPETGAVGFVQQAGKLRCTGSGRTYLLHGAGWWDFRPWASDAESLTERLLQVDGVRALHAERVLPTLRRLVSRQSIEASDELAFQLLNASPGARVLDVGTGTGAMARRLAASQSPDEGGWVVALDRSGARLDAAARHGGAHPRPVWVRGEATRLPFVDGTFDRVQCRIGLSRLEAPELLLRELARVLQPGGRLVISTLASAARNLPQRVRRSVGEAVGVVFFAPEDLPRMLEREGLRPREEVIEGAVIHLSAEVVDRPTTGYPAGTRARPGTGDEP
jgi:ubiquinone/menaquinone biosynthesis C-methylase UbiE